MFQSAFENSESFLKVNVMGRGGDTYGTPFIVKIRTMQEKRYDIISSIINSLSSSRQFYNVETKLLQNKVKIRKEKFIISWIYKSS